MLHRLLIPFVAAFLIAACDKPAAPPEKSAKPSGNVPLEKSYPRIQDPEQIARGGKLYQQHCVTCHGVNAEGAPEWNKAGPDGKYPPPPLNGTAHAWHHPLPALKNTIRNGTVAIGGKMPAWGHILTDRDMEDIIAWFQAMWSFEIYQAWARNNARVES